MTQICGDWMKVYSPVCRGGQAQQPCVTSVARPNGVDAWSAIATCSGAVASGAWKQIG